MQTNTVLKPTYTYLYLSFGHDLISELSLLFALLAFVAALLIAEQPQSLRALQFDLKLLAEKQSKGELRKHATFIISTQQFS